MLDGLPGEERETGKRTRGIGNVLIRVCAFRRRNQLGCQLRNVLQVTGRIQIEVDRIGHGGKSTTRARLPDKL